MAKYRVVEATQSVPKGLLIEIDKLEQGGTVYAISQPAYRFVIDSVISHNSRITIANSNVVAVIAPEE